ncbi:MAG: hypothetical protein JWL77_22 [Chthonomonadaceae bacterium]|nr:hypothetical protein [Chthonomonadaceae bacterium]
MEYICGTADFAGLCFKWEVCEAFAAEKNVAKHAGDCVGSDHAGEAGMLPIQGKCTIAVV